ncbi:MAG: hypothetical protein ACE5J2_03215 [Nitrososphaerales archaeon]
MAKKKIRIQLDDGEGGKYSLSVEGNVTREKIVKVFELMELLDMEKVSEEANLNSVGSKIWSLVENKFSFGHFTSSELLEAYEDDFNEPVKLSVISTYLARFADRGMLIRNRNRKEWLYRKIMLKH